MGVQDTVELYEGKASGSDPKASLSRRNKYKPRTSDADILPSSPVSREFREEAATQEPVLEPPEPTPSAIPYRPARFVRHPFFQPQYQRIKTPDIPFQTLSKSPKSSEVEREGLPNRRTPTPRLAQRTRTPPQPDESEPLDSNHSDLSTISGDVRETKSVKQSDGSPTASVTAVDTVVDDGATLAKSYSAQLLPTPKDPSAAVHRPVPATTLFGRDAAPLYLPKLDKHLAALPVPEFTKWKGRGKEKGVPMFPPMEKLAASKLTIDDLEHNSTVVPTWRDRNFWFSLASSAVVGILVWKFISPTGPHPNCLV